MQGVILKDREGVLKYLLDTDTCVYLLNGSEALKAKIKEIGVFSIAVSNSVLSELYFGAYNSKKVEANLKRIEEFKKNISVISDSEESAEHFGRIKAALRIEGKIIEDFDIIIASIALANRYVLVTNNTSHFKRIEGLIFENWLEAKA